MSAPRASLGVVALALALCHSAALAQSYGPQQQVLTIGGAEFENMSNFGYYYIHDDGYLYTGNTSDYAAPLSLPEGSSIEGICLFAFDDNPAPLARVSTAVYAVKLVPTGETAIVKAVRHHDDPDVLAEVSKGLGEAMVGIDLDTLTEAELLASRGW